MEWRLPKAVAKGDEVAVVVPSSAVRDGDALARGMQRLRDWGLQPSMLSGAATGRGLDWPEGCTLAATDEQRLAELQQALDEPRFRAVFCARGGYGAGRLLAELDWARFAADPKPIVGYSDITALLSAAAAETGVIGLHGPMVATTAAMDAGEDCWAQQRQLLMEPGAMPALPGASGACAIRPGTAEGRLVGGNLAVLQATIGTRWQPDTEDALLFLEDIGEAPYRVDRMLTHLQQSGMLDQAAGVVIGDFHVDGTALASEHAPMREVLVERLRGLEIPVAMGFAFGHRPGSWTLPFGGKARLEAPADGGFATLRLLGPVVR